MSPFLYMKAWNLAWVKNIYRNVKTVYSFYNKAILVIDKKWESHVFTQLFVFLVAKYTNKEEFKTIS